MSLLKSVNKFEDNFPISIDKKSQYFFPSHCTSLFLSYISLNFLLLVTKITFGKWSGFHLTFGIARKQQHVKQFTILSKNVRECPSLFLVFFTISYVYHIQLPYMII
ncbi:hypothetical protein CHS0354_026498 [Potamilus streckersoni]|uniref:Uncharacterized protein n=1 Tax=Potamilus streckersoni TaxID=2493646 RepID=A0AAE0RQA3_9BIVA|nr:hypothetical protein CHS0354_026498 [Potamilus streckersoni]